jgi:hypothetical protein
VVAQARETAARPPLWGRAGFGVAAVAAAVGDALFLRASPDAGTSTGWTAFFATYLGLAATAAVLAALGRGTARAAGGGWAAGAAIAFNLLALLSIGVFLLPLTVWVVFAALQAGRETGRARALMLATGAAALVAPVIGFVLAPP